MRRPRKVTPAVPAPAAATDSPADAASASKEDEEFGGFDSSDGEEPSGTAPPSPASSDDEGDGKKTAKPLARSKNTSDEVSVIEKSVIDAEPHLSKDSDGLDSVPRQDRVERKALMVVLRDVICVPLSVAAAMLNNGIKSSDDFRLLTKEDINDLCMRLKMGSMHTKRILVFAKWMHHAPNSVDVAKEFTASVLRFEMMTRAAASYDNVTTTAAKAEKSATSLLPEPFDGSQKKWLTFRYGFEAWAGASGSTFTACIAHHSDRYSKADPTGPHTSPRDVSDLFALSPVVNITRNATIFYTLMSLTSAGDAWGLVEPHEHTKDGRSAWISLCAFYEGTSQVGLTTEQARATVMESVYTGLSKQFSFTKYVARHISANNALLRNKEGYSDAQKTNFFLKGITDPALLPYKATAEARLDDWNFNRVVNYMRTSATKLSSKDRSDSRNVRQTKTTGRATGNQRGNDNKRRGSSNRPSNKGAEKPSRPHKHVLPPELWEALTPAIRESILSAKRSIAPPGREAKRAKSSDTDNSSSTVESYSQLPSSKKPIRKHTCEDHVQVDSSTPETLLRDAPTDISPHVTTKKVTFGAGVLFGRYANRVSLNRMVRSGSHFDQAPWRKSDFRLNDATLVRIRQNRSRGTKTPTNYGEAVIDTGADTVCVGAGYSVLSYTGRSVSLRGFHDDGETFERIPVVTAATAYDYDDGTTVILIFHEALNLGPTQTTSLINLNQIRHAGHQTDDIPKFLSQGKSLHGIETLDGDYIPFELKGRASLLYSRVPTQHELDNCQHIDLTCDQPWDPNSKDWEENEAKYTRHDRSRRACYTDSVPVDILPDWPPLPVSPGSVVPDFHNRVMNPRDIVREIKYATIGASISSPRVLDVDRDKLRRILGHVPMEVVERTLTATTQLAERTGEMPLHRRYKTKFEQLRYRRLKCTLYSDTFKSSIKSSRGHTHTQGFVCGDSYFIYHYLMKAESAADQGLAEFIHNIGIPAQLHTDNAKVETLSKWKKLTSSHWIKTTVTEPYSPWQNRCEHEFGAARIHTRLVLETTKCPEQLWDYALAYVIFVRNHTARKALAWITPITAMTGDTHDISEILVFEFFEPVQYFDNPDVKFPQNKAKVGRWLGIATNVGQALCYHILTDKGTVITRSTVTPLQNLDSSALQTALATFDATIREIYQPSDFALGNKIKAPAFRRDEAMKVARRSDDPGDGNTRNRHVLYDLNEGDDHIQLDPGLTVDDFFENDSPDQDPTSLIIGTDVLLTSGAVQRQGRVTKRDRDGTPVPNDDPGNFVVEFDDGTEEVHGYQALLDAVYKQVDDDGNEWYTFDDIVDHQKRPRGGRGRTRGWFLRVKWANGEFTWEPLTSLKESNPYPVAKYAADHDLLSEHAFSYWAPTVLKKADRWIRAAKTRKKKNRYKYGIEVSRSTTNVRT
jgi:hypothetical protein